MKRFTAVEWLIDKFPSSIENQFKYEIDKAKAMEKEQIENAYWDGWQNIPSMKPEQYYNETYGKE